MQEIVGGKGNQSLIPFHRWSGQSDRLLVFEGLQKVDTESAHRSTDGENQRSEPAQQSGPPN